MAVIIRDEESDDPAGIRSVTAAAFAQVERSAGTEGAIVDALRAAGALTMSLVAVDDERIVGHVAFSPVRLDAGESGWFGLGPVAVEPDRQGLGIGGMLIEKGLGRLRVGGAKGCIVVGNPRYYGRFGFVSDPALRYRDVPPRCVQRIVFEGPPPTGAVAYHPGFDAV